MKFATSLRLVYLFISIYYNVHFTKGQSMHVGSCPNPRVMDDFEMNQFLGMWYEVERTFSFFEEGVRCIKSEFIADDTGVRLWRHGLTITNLTHSITRGKFRITPYASPARMRLKLNGVPVPLKYRIIDTDYYNYAVVWSCFELPRFGGRLGHTENLKILSRTPQLPKNYQQTAHGSIADNDLFRTFLRRYPMRRCPLLVNKHLEIQQTNVTDANNTSAFENVTSICAGIANDGANITNITEVTEDDANNTAIVGNGTSTMSNFSSACTGITSDGANVTNITESIEDNTDNATIIQNVTSTMSNLSSTCTGITSDGANITNITESIEDLNNTSTITNMTSIMSNLSSDCTGITSDGANITNITEAIEDLNNTSTLNGTSTTTDPSFNCSSDTVNITNVTEATEDTNNTSTVGNATSVMNNLSSACTGIINKDTNITQEIDDNANNTAIVLNVTSTSDFSTDCTTDDCQNITSVTEANEDSLNSTATVASLTLTSSNSTSNCSINEGINITNFTETTEDANDTSVIKNLTIPINASSDPTGEVLNIINVTEAVEDQNDISTVPNFTPTTLNSSTDSIKDTGTIVDTSNATEVITETNKAFTFANLISTTGTSHSNLTTNEALNITNVTRGNNDLNISNLATTMTVPTTNEVVNLTTDIFLEAIESELQAQSLQKTANFSAQKIIESEPDLISIASHATPKTKASNESTNYGTYKHF